MLRSLLRILFGFVIACLVAGIVQTLFVVTPADLVAASDRAAGTATLMLLTATQSAIFALPFAGIAIGLGEWFGARSWLTWALFGIAIAMTAYVAVIASEPTSRTILNDYAFKAFLTTGFVAGFCYWIAAGRNSGAWHRPAEEKAETVVG